MSFQRDLIPVSEKFIKTYDINISKDAYDEVLPLIVHHMDALIYNVTSIACVMALINGKRKIESSDLAQVMLYISSKCLPKKENVSKDAPKNTKGQSGGSVTGFPLEYFNVSLKNSPFVSSPNVGANVSTEKINFEEGYSRDSMGPMTGGGKPLHFMDTNKNAIQFMKKILKHHDTKISNEAIPMLMHIMDIHLLCFANDLKSQMPLTVTKMNQILKLKRHAVFH